MKIDGQGAETNGRSWQRDLSQARREDVDLRRGGETAVNPRRSNITEAGERAYVLPVDYIFLVLRRRLWIILLSAVLLAGGAIGVGLLQTPLYEASIKILVGQESQNDQPSNLGGDVQGLQQLTQTMAEAVDSRPVAEAVIEDLNLRTDYREFSENLIVEAIPETQFVRVSYRDSDPREARRVVNAVGDEFAEQISEVSTSASSITATVWERAAIPEQAASPNLLQYALLALATGIIIGIGLAFLLELLDDRWESPEEAEEISGAPTLGTVPRFVVQEGKKEGN